MMPRFKDFGSGGEVSYEPVSFKLYGEDFHCRPALQGKVLLDMAANSNTDGNAGKVINDFFAQALLPESHVKFEALINDPEKIVPVETLGEIVGWLVEEYSNRPTQEPSRS
jgi:hypothetical protein